MVDFKKSNHVPQVLSKNNNRFTFIILLMLLSAGRREADCTVFLERLYLTKKYLHLLKRQYTKMCLTKSGCQCPEHSCNRENAVSLNRDKIMSVVIDLGSCLYPRTISEATHSFVEYCACDIFFEAKLCCVF